MLFRPEQERKKKEYTETNVIWLSNAENPRDLV